MFLGIGIGAAIGGRFGITVSWHMAGRYDILEALLRPRLVSKGIAMLVSLFVLLCDAFVEMCGLLRLLASSQAPGVDGTTPPPVLPGGSWLFGLVGMLVMLGFIVYYSVTGFSKGQSDGRGERKVYVQDAAVTRGSVPGPLSPDQKQKLEKANSTRAMVLVKQGQRDRVKAEMQEEKAALEVAVALLEKESNDLSASPSVEVAEAQASVEEAKGESTLAQERWSEMLGDVMHTLNLQAVP